MSNYTNLNCEIYDYNATENENLLKVKIRVAHDGYNKKTKISWDAIEEARESIRNTPILARVLDNEEDFNEHDVELVRKKGKYKLNYVEKAIGVIGYDSELGTETIGDRKYLTATGYIWTKYNSEATQIIEESDEKGVSMEIQILEGGIDEEDGVYDVKKFLFTGVTVLGDHVEPAMYDSILVKYSIANDCKQELQAIYQAIYSLNNEKEEKESMSDVKDNEIVDDKVEDTTEVEDNKEEDQVKDTDEKTEEEQPEGNEGSEEPIVDNNEQFSLSVDDIYSAISDKLNEDKIEVDYWGETYLESRYWINTILPMDKIVVLNEAMNWNKYVGVPFDFNGDNVELYMDQAVPYIREWRAKNEGETEPTNYSIQENIEKLGKESFSKMNETITSLNSELEKLQVFKAEKDKEEREVEVKEIVADFDALKEEEYDEIMAQAIEGELGIEQFKKELFCMLGMKSYSSKEKFSNKDEKEETVKTLGLQNYDNGYKEEINGKAKNDKYGGIFEKYGITE